MITMDWVKKNKPGMIPMNHQSNQHCTGLVLFMFYSGHLLHTIIQILVGVVKDGLHIAKMKSVQVVQ